ncbi:hypothetical protein HYPSUDRAFT_197768 [Hypholoma sublateritium FD-334 SS-4]|uniref:Uncharacterized protein n=1 Tax=Hypholoma sublateritium (strain FD-334 SS-4) TaxID=945553 RepID=A0A0D2MU84_HYPSF|nr:hypothetical protein HYPSUDRAFT_197768 [Hypholoma sublateritium FD-334 SS-4]
MRTGLGEVWNIVWKAKFETLQAAYNLLLDRVPGLPEAQRQKLDPNDYKFIDYWFKHQWVASAGDRVTDITGKAENEDEDTEDLNGEDLQSIFDPAPAGAQRGQGRSRAGINVAMRFIQDCHGQVIDGHRAREIRIHARALFVGFALQGKQFLSWGDADALSRKTFYNEMVSRFEELQYCDLDWKSEQIAIDTSLSISPGIFLFSDPTLFIMTFLPFTNNVNAAPLTGMLPMSYPTTGSQPKQAPEITGIQPIPGEEKEKWAKLSANAKAAAKTAS